MESDTIKLLRECGAGAKMGTASIKQVIDHAGSRGMRSALSDCLGGHEALEGEIDRALARFGDDGKDPNPIARGMSWIKTEVKLGLDDSDHVIAGLMTDGCDMGIRSIAGYLEKYRAADDDSRAIAEKLIKEEERLMGRMKDYM